MKELASALIDYMLAQWSDLALVTPAGFATALRIVGGVPDDASPWHLEAWVRRFGEIRVGAASPELSGWGYQQGDSFVIETGKGRSVQERNITIPHEFGERLHVLINEELQARGVASVDWGERFWDAMGVELVAPLASFRAKALRNGLDLIELADRLSFESVVYRAQEAFEYDVPLFAVYAGNAGNYEKGRGYDGDVWRVRARAYTKRWLSFGYLDGQEQIHIAGRGAFIRDGSLVREVCAKRRSILARTCDVVGRREVETTVLLRARFYGKEPAWVMAVGVERRYDHLLRSQVALADPIERSGTLGDLF
ncbi:MAG: hypothetical protein WD359_08045 [Dehalococcoidia bacterium]